MGTVLETLLPARLGRNFRWLVAASWATNLSDGIMVAAGPLLVASLTDDPVLISLAALLRWMPPLLFSLSAGVLSDRVDRRRIVIVANCLRAAVLAGLVVATVTGRLTAAGALSAIAALTTAEVFADNTTSTLTPMLVRREDLGVANVRLQGGFLTLNHLAGPAVGAALFTAGRAWPFLAQVVLLVAGVLLVSRVALPPATGHAPPATGDVSPGDVTPAPGGPAPVREATSVFGDVAEGLRWTVRHPAVRTLSLTILVFNVTYGAAWSVLVLYAQQRLGLGPVGFGLLTTVSAVGGLLGTASYGFITARVSLGDVMRAGLIVETLTHLALAATTSGWAASAVMFVFGAHAFIWGTTSITIRQRAVPHGLQGRVGGVNTLSTYAGLVAGSAIGGPLAAYAGITAPFWFGFAGSAVLVVVLWRELARIAHADEHAGDHPDVSRRTPDR